MKNRATLKDLLGPEEPNSTFHDADLVTVQINYSDRTAQAEFDLPVGTPVDGILPTRCGQLVLTGLFFWVVEPPKDLEKFHTPPWLAADGLLHQAPTQMGKHLAKLVPPDAQAWFLYFTNWNAYIYCAASEASFHWR